jgi:hypothetical protein
MFPTVGWPAKKPRRAWIKERAILLSEPAMSIALVSFGAGLRR